MPSKSRNRASRSATVVSLTAPPVEGGSRPLDGSFAVAEGPAVVVEPNPFAPVPEEDDDPVVDTPLWAEMYERAFTRYQERRELIDREQQEAQRLWEDFLRAQGEQVPEGERSLVANDELHRQLMELAGTDAGRQYQMENVIGDPNQTFGIEIEFDGGNPTEIARAMYEAGLASSPRQEGYHSSHRRPGMWSVETDATVNGEVVSPVLRDTPETWAQLQRV